MCTNIRFKPKSHWKADPKTRLVPVWKIVRLRQKEDKYPYDNKHGITITSPMRSNQHWAIGNNFSDRKDGFKPKSPTPTELNNGFVASGLHCFYRKKDAEYTLNKIAGTYRSIFQPLVILKMYVHEKDIVCKGYGFIGNGYGIVKDLPFQTFFTPLPETRMLKGSCIAGERYANKSITLQHAIRMFEKLTDYTDVEAIPVLVADVLLLTDEQIKKTADDAKAKIEAKAKKSGMWIKTIECDV